MPALEHLDDAIDAAQDEVFERPTTQTIQTIFQIKRSTIRLHRILGPQREVLNRLARDEYAQIAAEHRVYFRDVYDHLVRIHDITESLRDLISGALDTYLSAISNRTNEIMKTLTLVTVMFMPMSFLVGFFGMNFFGDDPGVQVLVAEGHALRGRLPGDVVDPRGDVALGASAGLVLRGRSLPGDGPSGREGR